MGIFEIDRQTGRRRDYRDLERPMWRAECFA